MFLVSPTLLVTPTEIRIGAAIVFVILVTFLVMRRKRMAAKRRPMP